jgi:hypothetical protein
MTSTRALRANRGRGTAGTRAQSLPEPAGRLPQPPCAGVILPARARRGTAGTRDLSRRARRRQGTRS